MSVENMVTKPYQQVKVSISAEVAAAFKLACATSNVSMASMLSQFMAEYSSTAPAKRNISQDYSTKRRRRDAVHKIILQLERIKECEERFMGNIPENLQGSIVYDRAEGFVSCLDEAIDALASIGQM